MTSTSAVSTPVSNELSPADRARIRSSIRKARLKEWCLFGSAAAKRAVALSQYAKAKLEFARGRTFAGWQTLMRLHRAALSPLLDRRIERRIAAAVADGSFQTMLAEYVASVPATGRVTDLFAEPLKIFGPHATVLKAASGQEKGVLLLNYTYIYAPFARLFDLDRITERYYIVLEPSWTGGCDENMLPYGLLRAPTFVQTTEPRDIAFLRQFPGTLVPIPIAANWWVDHELYRPLPDVPKDTDLVMVAAWADFKRHYAFFEALAEVRRRGRKLTTILAGYPSGLTMSDIEDLARYHGVRDQIELHEWLPPEQVNRIMNRARVNVLWSLREGYNRAIVEGLYAGLPCIMREGHNYGHHHVHVNPQTGQYLSESGLPDALVDMVDNVGRYKPREWVLANISYDHATEVLEQHIRAEVERRGEHWSGHIARHVTFLHGNKYLDESDSQRFQKDYDYLASTLRPQFQGNLTGSC